MLFTISQSEATNLHTEGEEADEDKQVVALKLVYIFYYSCASWSQSRWQLHLVPVEKFVPWLNALPPFLHPLTNVDIGHLNRH